MATIDSKYKQELIRRFGKYPRRFLIDLDLTWVFDKENQAKYKGKLKKVTDKEGNERIILPLIVKIFSEDAEHNRVIKVDEEKNYILRNPGFIAVDRGKDEKALYLGLSSVREFVNIVPREPEAVVPNHEDDSEMIDFDTFQNDKTDDANNSATEKPIEQMTAEELNEAIPWGNDTEKVANAEVETANQEAQEEDNF